MKKVFSIGCSILLAALMVTVDVQVASADNNEEMMDFYIEVSQEMQEYTGQYMSGDITSDEFDEKVRKNITPKLDTEDEELMLKQGEDVYKEIYTSISAFGLSEYVNDLAESSFGVNSKEIALFAAHPIKATKAMRYAQIATDETNERWKGWTTWQGNGDAYRHALWSALMNNHIDKDFAYQESYAHEGYDVGTYSKISDLDVKMDLENNHRGRDLGDVYLASEFDDEEIFDGVFKSVGNRKFVRIREKALSGSSYDKTFYENYNAKTVLRSYFIQTNKEGQKDV